MALKLLRNLKTRPFLVAGVFEVKNNHNTVILCNLTRKACLPFVLAYH